MPPKVALGNDKYFIVTIIYEIKYNVNLPSNIASSHMTYNIRLHVLLYDLFIYYLVIETCF